MRISVSNIAWDTSEDESMVVLLKKYGVDAIDIAPGKYFPNPAQASMEEIVRVRSWWEDRGISLVGMQSLLFGTKGFNVFSSSREDMLSYLGQVCRVAGALGSTRMVFGSPRNRDRSGLSDEQAKSMGKDFFSRLGDIAAKESVTICLEPNPTFYGANFMTTCIETDHMVRYIAHPNVGMQFDTGALAINGENPEKVLARSHDIIRHVHISEKNLVPLGDGTTEHEQMAAAAQRYLPNHIATIEMRATNDEPHLVAIERAVHIAQKHYGVQS
jgi:D-psicose/D-tagatose/L-ribulose 3-epimerase